MRSKLIAGAALVAMTAYAQSPLLPLLDPLSSEPNGVHLYSASISAGYYSLDLPGGVIFAPTGGSLGGLTEVSAAATFGWTRSRPNSSLSVIYSPSFTSVPNYSPHLNSLNHSLSINGSRKLGRKWTASISVYGSTNNFEQFLFSPTLFSSVVSVPATFDDLATAILNGTLFTTSANTSTAVAINNFQQFVYAPALLGSVPLAAATMGELSAAAAAGTYSNNQLASLLTGAPILVAPASSYFYGNRVLSAGVHTGLSYAATPRLSLTFGAGGSRTQQLPRKENGDTPVYLVPQTTSANASLGLSYALTPRTQFGVQLSGSRSFSALEDVYTTYASLNLGRSFSRRWFGQAHGGAGKIIPLRFKDLATTGIQAVAGGSVGYKTFAHTFLGSYDRTISDSYGFGAGSTQNAMGAWSWRRPNRSWWIHASGGWQKLQGGAFHDITDFYGTAGFGKLVGRHEALQFEYVHGNYSAWAGGIGGSLGSGIVPQLTQNAVLVSLVFAPHPNFYH
jgi:hypothetical protein